MTDPLTAPLEAWLATLPTEYGPEERILLAIGFTAGRLEGNKPSGEPCAAETWSWNHFTPNQVDPYWIRCTLWGDHDEHEDGNTGLTWKPKSA